MREVNLSRLDIRKYMRKAIAFILNTYPLKSIVSKLFQIYSKTRSNYNHHKKYLAPIDPLKLHFIDPCMIEKRSAPSFFPSLRFHSEIIGGTWDLNNTIDLNQKAKYQVWKSLHLHFQEGMSWQQTPIYSIVLDEIKKGSEFSYHGCKTEEDLKERLKNIDRMYELMQKNGYQTQKEIRSKKKKILQNKNAYIPPEFDEILVSIDRNGNYIMEDGFHRLSLAQILKIKKIPVRVLARHHLWQKRRDFYYAHRKLTPPVHQDMEF